MPPLAHLRPSAALPLLTAHQGGLDELALVAIPLAIVAALLWLAARRAAREQDEEEQQPEGDDAGRHHSS